MRPSNKPAGITNRHLLRVQAPHAGLFVRTALLAVLAIGGAVWALVRHYTYSPPPLRVPRQATTTHEGDDPSILQAPELLGSEDAG